MKTMKRLLVVLLVFTMVTSSILGCGKKEDGKQGGTSATDVEISVWNSGLGIAWLEALIKEFKEIHPEYNVYFSETASSDAAVAAYGMEDVDTVDLYLSVKNYDTTYMEPLNEMLNSTAEGDSKPLIDKFNEAYLALEETTDGEIHSLTYGGGVTGLVYNKELFEKAGIKQLPRTSDELATVCNTLSTKKIVPLCHFQGGGYWTYLEEAWYGQYEGTDYYFNTFYGNPTKETLLKKDGRYEVLKALEKIITPDYILSGSNTSDHTTMQTKFLLGEAAMMVSGAWLANEMKSGDKMDNFLTMKTPVLSSITDKLTTVTKEADLRKVIDAIDAVTDGKEEITAYQQGADYVVNGKAVSAADWDYLYAARNTVPDIYAGHAMYIPTYSNAKEGAKEFIKFMYSDKGYQIYADTLHILLPIEMSNGEVDTSEWNEFEKCQVELMNSCVQSFSKSIRSKHELFRFGGATMFANVKFEGQFCSRNEADRINADKAWELIVQSINDNYESNWLANIQ